LHARKPEDLACPDGQTDVGEVTPGQPLHDQSLLPSGGGLDRCLRRKDCAEGPPDDELDDLLLRDVGRVEYTANLSVTQDGEAVGDVLDLANAVRDVDDRRAAGGELADPTEKTEHLLLVEVLGRLVEDEHLRLQHERFRDLDDEALLDRQVRDAASGIDPHLPGVKSGLRPARRRPQAAASRASGTDRHVLGDGEVGQQRGVLAHDGKAELARLVGLHPRELPAADADHPLVGHESAGRHGHQRRLAGAVLPDECVHLPCTDGQGHVRERAHAREGLDDARQLEPEVGVADTDFGAGLLDHRRQMGLGHVRGSSVRWRARAIGRGIRRR
jgi:hypothetical protein